MTQCYIVNNEEDKMKSSEIMIANETQYAQATQVFENEKGLLDKFNEINFTQNLNIFLLKFQNTQELLIDLTEVLLKKSKLLLLQSFDQVVQNVSFSTLNNHINSHLLEQNSKVDPKHLIHNNFYQVITTGKQFIAYYQKVLVKQLQKTNAQQETVLLLKFKSLQKNNYLYDINLVVADTQNSARQITFIAQKLHCFEWNELNNYQKFIQNKQLDDQDDYALIADNTDVFNDHKISEKQLLTDTQIPNSNILGSTYGNKQKIDPVLYLKYLIVNNKSIYIQQVSEIEQDDLKMIAKMSMLRNTQFKFRKASQVQTTFEDKYCNQIKLLEQQQYFAFYEENGQILDIVENQRLQLKYLLIQQNQTIITNDLKYYVENLPKDEQISIFLGQSKMNTFPVSSQLIYSTSADQTGQETQLKQQYIAELIARNQNLILQMYTRLQESEEALINVKQEEQDERVKQNLDFYQKLGVQVDQQQLTQENIELPVKSNLQLLQLKDLENITKMNKAVNNQNKYGPSTQQDENTLQSVFTSLYLNILQQQVNYQKQLNHYCFLNQQLDIQQVNKNNDVVEQIKQQINQNKNVKLQQKPLNNELNKLSIDQLKQRLGTQYKLQKTIESKQAEVQEYINNCGSVTLNKQKKIKELETQLSKKKEYFNRINNTYQTNNVLIELHKLVGYLQDFVINKIQISQVFEPQSADKRYYYKLRGVQQLVTEYLNSQLQYSISDVQLKTMLKDFQTECTLYCNLFSDFGYQKLVQQIQKLAGGF